MKKLLYILFLAAASLVFMSCSKETELSVSKDSFSVSGDKESIETFDIVSNTEWAITVSEGWIVPTPVGGSGTCLVKVRFMANPDREARKGTLTVATKDGSLSKTISVDQTAMTPKFPLIDNNIIAHRGARLEYSLPDNSIAALKKAIELNCYGSECDIIATADGQVVVTHDTKWGGKYIKDETYETLKGLKKLSNGEDLPLFRDYLKTAMSGNGTKLFVDVKSLSDEAGGNEVSIRAGIGAARIVKELHAEEYVRFIVGRAAVYNGVSPEVKGAWPMAYMNQEATHTTFKNMGCTWGNFDISAFGLDDTKLAGWQSAGIIVSFYNIDTDEQIAWWLPHRKDVMACTNYPHKLLQTLGLRE